MLFGWAACALAVLSKGLIGIVLPAGAVALYVLWQRDWRLLARLELGAGLALFLAIAAPWFIMVSLANHEFARFFFIHEHFERFLTKDHGRYQPWWYFLPLLALGAVPWTLALPGALASRRAPPPAAVVPAAALPARLERAGVRLLLGLGLQAVRLHPADLPRARDAARRTGCRASAARAGLARARPRRWAAPRSRR